MAISKNIIIIYAWKSPRKLILLYCIYSKEWMKKLKRGKEYKYLIISVVFPDTHLCEHPGILSDFKAICKCLGKWTYLLIRRSSRLTLLVGLGVVEYTGKSTRPAVSKSGLQISLSSGSWAYLYKLLTSSVSLSFRWGYFCV